ncbi:MAG TPA: sulfite exporter TauE/SafE family protein [Burkholderiales bacterium]
MITAGVLAVTIAAYFGMRVDLGSLLAADFFHEIPPRWLVISAIVFLAAVVSSTVGFAFSAIAGAMILHCVPDGVEAVQIMMIASIGIQAYCVAGLSRSIDWFRCAPFILGGIAALPIGIVLLLNLQPRTYALAMGAALVAYGLTMLLRRPLSIRSRIRWRSSIGPITRRSHDDAASPAPCPWRLRHLPADGLRHSRFTRDDIGADRREGGKPRHR